MVPPGAMGSGRTGRRFLVAVAWPYANGPLHLGHIAGSLLPPDVFARYHRLRGDDVLMVSGSDMHGTPITVAAEKAGVPPGDFAARYNESHKASLRALAIHFDLFTSTATANHRAVVWDVFRTLATGGHIVRTTMRAPYDPQVRRFLPDRYVEGECPNCHSKDARGDQCDACGRTLDPQELIDPRSKLTGAPPEFRDTEHFFLRLPAFQVRLAAWVDRQAAVAQWRPNTVNFTRNWLAEGLKDRAITRDLAYGVPIPPDVPIDGRDEKRIYVWFEAVIGYLSAAKQWAADRGEHDRWKDYWLDPACRAYYFLGKDNIPFHTIIWPAMLLGYSDGSGVPHNLPFDVPANEFMNFQGAKFSKSRGNLLAVDEVLSAFEADAVRYYLAANMPESGDTNWAWDDFVAKVNDELVATVGNYVNRVISFADQHWDGAPRPGAAPADLPKVQPELDAALAEIEGGPAGPGRLQLAADGLEACRFKESLRHVVHVARVGNQRFNDLAPWALVKQGPDGKDRAAAGVLWHLGVVKTLAVALQPFLPTVSDAVWRQLGEPGPSPRALAEACHVGKDHWPTRVLAVAPGQRFGPVAPIVAKLDAAAVLADAAAANRPTATTTAHATPAKSEERKPLVTIEEFQKLELRTAVVTSVEDHPKADKLYVLQLDAGGETRQVCAGLRGIVPKEDLVGKTVVFVANLQPAKLRGVESQGMILAAEDATGKVVPIGPLGKMGAGAKVR